MNALLRNPVCRRCLCGLAYVCAFFVLASVLVHRIGFPLDDSWIHQVIARNFAEYHKLGFAPGKLTAGSTSLLWSALFALYWTVFPHLSPVIANAGTSAVLLFLIGYVLKAITEEDDLPSGVSWCLALAPLASGNFLWFGMIGMEHLLFILLSLCLVRCWLRKPPIKSCFEGAGLVAQGFSLGSLRRQRPSKHWGFSPGGNANLYLLALLSFLLVLTRPEGLFLGLLLLLTLRTARRSWTALVAAFAGGALALAVIVGTNWLISHSLTPQTMQGRQFLYRFSADAGLRTRLIFLGQIVARCLKTWSFLAPRELLHGRGLLLGAPVVLLLAIGLLAGLRRLYQLRARRMLLLCAWGGLIVLLYTAVLPSAGHGGRYLAVPLTLFLPLELLGLHQLLSASRPTQRHAWALVACVALLSGARSLAIWREATTAQIAQIETEHGVMATWLQNTLPSSSFAQGKVAVFDIGRIGYQLHGNVVDLGGLMDATYLPYVLQHRTADYLFARGIQYVVLPSAADEDSADWKQRLSLDGGHGVDLQPIHSVCVASQTDWLAENSADTAYACQRAYKLIYRTSSTSLAH
jgi:hypothetical protein